MSQSQARPCSPGATGESINAHSSSNDASVKNSSTPPYWNDESRAHWLGPQNVGYALIDGQWETVLIDSGARGNAVVPWYVKQHGLKVEPVSDLASNPASIPVSGIGGHTTALGYVVFNIQIEGIPSY